MNANKLTFLVLNEFRYLSKISRILATNQDAVKRVNEEREVKQLHYGRLIGRDARHNQVEITEKHHQNARFYKFTNNKEVTTRRN